MKSKHYRLLEKGKGFTPISLRVSITPTASAANYRYMRVPFDMKIIGVKVGASVASQSAGAVSLKSNRLSAGTIDLLKDDLTWMTAAEVTAAGCTPADLSGACILFGGTNLAVGVNNLTCAVASADGHKLTVSTDTLFPARSNCEMKEGDLLCIHMATQGTDVSQVVEWEVLAVPTY